MRMIWNRFMRRRKPAVQMVRHTVDSRYCGLHDAVLSGWFNNETGELHPNFPIRSADRVLDFGCGAGGATQFCARHRANVTFLDSDEGKITHLNHLLRDSAGSHLGIVNQALPLPLGDACFNRIIAQEVLEHVDEPSAVLAELYRVGEPGALYLLAVPHARSERLQQGIAPDSHFAAPNHQHVFDEAMFTDLVQDSGLEIVSRHDFGFYWAFWMMLYWADFQAEGKQLDAATHDLIAPPYAELLNDWATLWQQLLQLPAGPAIKRRLDALLPKSQIVVARKPLSGSR
ncbi:class I SAM-dependent methyltransferase [Pseudomonas sp. NPDC077649]|uniref:class I SAM-dependent methyltransferase n=1 Tax=Pseudomonas sp. NPDC077649 TaxID=3364423 RepID=UPI0037C882C4